jgi:hypothetical protein
MEYFIPLPEIGEVTPPHMVAIDVALKCAVSFISTLTAIPRTCMQHASPKRRRHRVLNQNISVRVCAVVRTYLCLRISVSRNCIVLLGHRKIAFTFTLSPSPLLHSAITFPTVLTSLTRTLFSLAMSSGLHNEAKNKNIACLNPLFELISLCFVYLKYEQCIPSGPTL